MTPGGEGGGSVFIILLLFLLYNLSNLKTAKILAISQKLLMMRAFDLLNKNLQNIFHNFATQHQLFILQLTIHFTDKIS